MNGGKTYMNITELSKEIEASDIDDELKSQLKEHLFLFKQAGRAMEEERLEDGISILEMLLQRAPHDLAVQAMLATAYSSAGHPIKSIRMLEDIYEQEPDDGEYSFALALAYRRQDWVQKALKQLKITVSLSPDNRKAWEHLAECSMEIEDTHEATMNCFGAMYILNEYGIKSIKLNALAFSLTIEENEKADKYLTNILDIMDDEEKYAPSYYEGVVNDLLWEVNMSECYEFIPRIKEIAKEIPDISESIVERLSIVERRAEIIAMDETYPKTLCGIIKLLDNGCDCEECMRNLISMECSVLVDLNGYQPELMRLHKEHPKLYEMHSKFFDEAISGVDRERSLSSRLRTMSESGFEPILIRADGSEVNPVVETYRREGPKIGRNELCPCGSGVKYKKCCGS